MPRMKDCISKFTLSPNVAHQESYTTTILKWMQDNPEQLKRTTMGRMAKTMKLGNVTNQTEARIKMTLHNMVTRRMLTYAGGQGRAKKTFFINYLHQNMPKEIIERAPKEEIERHEELAGVKLLNEKEEDEQNVEPMEKEEPAVESLMDLPSQETPLSEAPTVTPSVEVQTKDAEPAAAPSVPTMDVPISLEKMPNGNFTLQLNINFTINSKG